MIEASAAHWSLVIVQLLVATLCGGLIGYQRETTERPAGFRTHILVCVGSAIYMLVSVAVAGTQYDPGRIAAQVASGIGFLGAGTIIKQGSIVRGLTTAASLWAVAGIGLAAGYGGMALGIALIGTLVVFFSLTVLRQMEWWMERGRRAFVLTLTLQQSHERLMWVQSILTAHGVMLQGVTFTEEHEHIGDVAITGRVTTREELEAAITELSQSESVRGLHWTLK